MMMMMMMKIMTKKKKEYIQKPAKKTGFDGLSMPKGEDKSREKEKEKNDMKITATDSPAMCESHGKKKTSCWRLAEYVLCFKSREDGPEFRSLFPAMAS